MAEPISTIVGALVSLFTAYTTYKVGMAQAEQQNKPAPEKTEAAEKGEQVIVPVKEAVQKHGGEREQKVLANFEEDPEFYGDLLKQAITDLAQRDPSFAAALRAVAQQTGVVDQSGNVQINVAQGQGINRMEGGTINNTFN
jgi:hypothetical protein